MKLNKINACKPTLRGEGVTIFLNFLCK